MNVASGKKIRVGLVGCGRISGFHIAAIKNHNQAFELAAVCDSELSRAKKSGDENHVPYFTLLGEMLKADLLDVVVLTTPSGLHATQAKACADFNVACVSEKPFGVFYEESKEVVDYFEAKKVPLFVVMQNRYNPCVKKVREWFDQGLLGKIYLMQANVFWQRPQSYYDASSWRGTRALDGGAFMNQASHYVDLIQWFAGEIETAQSSLATFERKIECEDTGVSVFKFKTGTLATMAVTMLTYPENLEGSLTFLCENATIRIGGKSLNKLEVCRLKNHPGAEKVLTELNENPNSVYGNGHGEFYQKLSEFISNPAHPDVVTGREGIKSLKILSMIYRDADEKGRR